MNSCSRVCSPADKDENGLCKCDREAQLFPVEPVDKLIKKLRLYRTQLRQQLMDEMKRQDFKFIPLHDGLCSLDAAISKFEKFFDLQNKKA